MSTFIRNPAPYLFVAIIVCIALIIALLYKREQPPEPIKPPIIETTKAQPTSEIAVPDIEKQGGSPLGMNTNEVVNEDASIPFVDLFRPAHPFNEVPWLTTKNVTYDSDGWPIDLQGGKAGTMFLGKMPVDAIPKGEYTVLYEGEGKIEYGHTVKLIRQLQNKDIIELPAGKDGEINASLTITATNSQNPIRNIRILMSGGICQSHPFKHVKSASDCPPDEPYLSFVDHYQSIVFNPDYLNFMKDFKVLRFMGMSGITRNPAVTWNERPSPTEATWGGGYGSRGIPIETQVALANKLNADSWFNIPHAADDNYVERFATYVKENLKSELKIYIEYTNEAWNTTFIHTEYVQNKGIELGLDNNAVEAGQKYYVQRSVEVFNIWEKIFGDRKRFVRVIGSWDARPDITKKLLAWNETYKHADAVSIAPYFGGNIKAYRESTTVDEIFHFTEAEGSYRGLPQVLEHIEKQAKIAKKFGVDLIGYEGGQGLVDWVTRKKEQHPNPLFFAANRDERMGKLYDEFFAGWKKAGGKLFVAFSAPRTCQWFGCWGLKEHIRQPRETAHKYNATLNFIKNNPQWWSDNKKEASKPKVSLVSIEKKLKPSDPRIVFRPVDKSIEPFFLDNPRTLDTVVIGDDWVKKDTFGKWQGKWSKEYLYIIVKVYDEKLVSDSKDPKDDDSIEFYIDADNSRGSKYDGKNDFQFTFDWGSKKVSLSENSPKADISKIKYDMTKTADGYLLEAKIPWKILGVSPKVSGRLGIEIQLNDDDDGGERDKKISWIAEENNAANDPRLFGVVIISGR